MFIYLFIYVFCLKLEKGKEEASWHVVRRCRWDLGAGVGSKLIVLELHRERGV